MSDAKIVLTAVDQTTGAFQSVKASFAEIQGGVTQLKGSFGGLQAAVGGLVASLGVLAFGAMIKDVIGASAALADLSETTGATVEALSGLVEIGKLSGTSADQIGNAMTKLAKNMAAAGDEGKGAGRAIAALGLDFNSFIKLRPEDQMLALAKAMNGFADGNSKAAIAQALWGKEGAKNLVFMHDLAVAGDIQTKMTAAQAEESKNLSDNWVRLRVSGEEWKKELVGGMTPALDIALQAVVDVTNGSGGLRDMIKKLVADGTIRDWTNMAVTGMSFVLDGVVYVKRAFQSVGELIVANVTSAVEFVTSAGQAVYQAMHFDFSGAIATTRSAVDVQKSIWSSLATSMSDVWGAPTLGAMLRDRMKDLENVGTVAKKVKDDVNYTTPPKGGGNSAADPFAAVLASISQSTAALKLEMEAGDKLTERQKAAIKVLDDVRTGKLQLTQASAELLGKVLEENLAEERSAIVRDAARKASEDLTKAGDAMIKSLQDQIDAQAQHNAEIGLSKDAIAALVAQKAELSAAADNEMADNLRAAADYAGPLHDAYVQYAKDLDDAAAKKRGLAELKVTAAAKETMVDEAKRAAEEWKKTTDEINRTLTDALMNAFQSGAGFGKAFVKTVEDMFKTMVLRPIISAIVSPVSSAINTAIGGSNAANVGSVVSGAGSLIGTGSSLSMLSTAAGATMQNGLISGFGANMANVGTLMEGGSMMGALGAAMPYLGIAMLAYSLLSGSFKGETRSGGQYSNANFTGGPSGGEINGPQVRTTIDATIGSINGLLKDLGSTATLSNLQSGFESSQNGKGFAYAGGQLSTGAVFGQGRGALYGDSGINTNRGSMSAEEAAAAWTTELKQATLQALQAADVPGQLGDYLRQLGDIDKLSGGALDAALGKINKALTEKQQLEATLYDLTATDAQKLTDTRNAERAAIDGSNSALLEQIYALQDQKAAALAAAAADQAAAQAKQQADQAAAQAAAGVASERYNLETQLLQLQGNTVELRKRELAALDGSNQSLQEQIYALQDAQAATQAVTQAQVENNNVIMANQGDLAMAAADAAYKAQHAWDATAKSIADAMAKIRGDMTGLPGQALASVQAQFAIATAKARAGDQAAADSLPALAQQLATLGRDSASSLFDANRASATTANSLGTTLNTIKYGVQGYTPPVSYVPTTLASLAPVSAGSASAGGVDPNAALLETLRAQAAASASLQLRTVRVLENWEGHGMPQPRPET